MAKPPVSLDTLEHTPVEPSECGLYWVTPDGKRLRPLTPAHKKFCQLYVQGASGAEAARKAGFTKHKFGAKVQGSALLRKNPLIGNHIIELIKIEQERAVVSMDSHLTELSHLRDEAKSVQLFRLRSREAESLGCISRRRRYLYQRLKQCQTKSLLQS